MFLQCVDLYTGDSSVDSSKTQNIKIEYFDDSEFLTSQSSGIFIMEIRLFLDELCHFPFRQQVHVYCVCGLEYLEIKEAKRSICPNIFCKIFSKPFFLSNFVFKTQSDEKWVSQTGLTLF